MDIREGILEKYILHVVCKCQDLDPQDLGMCKTSPLERKHIWYYTSHPLSGKPCASQGSVTL